jgi:serine/threonine-protein kinase
MEAGAQPEPTGKCPDRQTLVDFHAGRLSDSGLVAVGAHIATCPACEKLLCEIANAGEDTLGVRLQGCLRAEPVSTITEPAYRAMEAAAKDIPAQCTMSADKAQDAPEGSTEEDLETPLDVQIGPYMILGVLGRGGMGVVYRARHTTIGQRVALKMIRLGAQHRSDLLDRFRTEAQAIARLQHPNIVRLYSYDEHKGQPYFVMELIEGRSLANKLKDGLLEFRDAAKLIQTLACAVAYAHSQHVIHRDLKPANVLLTADGETNLTPKVADFGLAKLLDEEGPGWTSTDGILGTPSYMAPEQAEGRPNDIDQRTDVYALGAILYELFTGQPPFLGKTKIETLRLVVEREIVAPARRRQGLPADLEAVCLKCLEADAAKRYQSAQALGDDLDRWLRGEPTLARPLNWAGRVKRWVRTRSRLVAAAVLVTAVVGVAITLSLRGPELDRASHADPSEAQRMDSELRIGHEVTLIGETGRPRYYRWQNGTGRGWVADKPDGTFSVSHPGIGLLELLPTLPIEHYRLSAEVRHDLSDKATDQRAAVGMFAGHVIYPKHGYHYHSLVQVAFNAVWGQHSNLLASVRPGLEENRLRLFPCLVVNDGDSSRDYYPETFVQGPKIDVLGERNTQWFHMEIVVSPAGVTVTQFYPVGGHTTDMLQMRLPADEINQLFALSLTKAGSAAQERQRDFATTAPTFVQGGGLGIVVARGSASFRKVTVTPLKPGG